MWKREDTLSPRRTWLCQSSVQHTKLLLNKMSAVSIMAAEFLVGVAIFVEKDRKILFGKRSENHEAAPGVWEVPSGRLEAGEDPTDAVRREGMEEMGVEVEPLQMFHACCFKRNGKDLILLHYHCRYKGTPARSREHSEFRWVTPIEAIDLLTYPRQKEAMRAYLQLCRPDSVAAGQLRNC